MEKRAMAVREEQWLQTIAVSVQLKKPFGGADEILDKINVQEGLHVLI